MSNFAFIKAEWPAVFASAAEAEKSAYSSPVTACFHARRAVELAVKWMYANDASLHEPYRDHLMALVHEPTFKQTLDPRLFTKLLTIVKLGNLAVHATAGAKSAEAVHAVRELYHFCYWLYRTYSKNARVQRLGAFDDSLLRAEPAREQSKREIASLQDRLQKQAEQLAEKDAAVSAMEKQLEDNLRLVAELKAQNQKVVDEHDYSEAETREFYVDLLLAEAGWNHEAPNVVEYPVTGMPNPGGEGFVDYVLWGDDGLPLALVEVKRTRKDPKIGKQQAKLYADCLENMHKQRPVIYYSNGYETWIWDDTNYPPRTVQGFYKKDELVALIQRRKNVKPLSSQPINKYIVDRYYQEGAIRAITEHLEKKQRRALVVMATGTGKTRISIALVELLQKSNWIKRVLFLADRNALVRQANNAFKEHLPNTPAVDITENRKDTNARIILSTYPTMMNLIDAARGDQKLFGPGHFDLIIIDEAHRSVYQKYRAIFVYFDSLLLGLTATPRDDIDHDTYELFELEKGVPVYAYELEQAVKDSYLVPYRAYAVPIKFQREGITYDELSKEEKEQYEEKFYDEETGVLPDKIHSSAINKWLFNTDTVDKVLRHVMEHGLKVEGGDRLGKTIIFAKNHNHAEFIVERFDKAYPHYAGHFCRVIDNQVKYAQSLIDDFGIAESHPTIAVSVDMLDTGIDVHEVLNLVFFKIVRSKTKFIQMIGRGTRLCPDIFGPGEHKKEFYIFDFCQNFEFFGENPEGFEIKAPQSISQRIFNKRLRLSELLLASQKQEEQALREILLDTLHGIVDNMNVDNFEVRPYRKTVEAFKHRDRWQALSEEDIRQLTTEVSRLPSELPQEHELAKRFDLLVVDTQLTLLEKNSRFDKDREEIVKIASLLESKQAVPMVNEQLPLILDLQTESFWEDITVVILEDVRKRLRDLVRFIDTSQQEVVYTTFEDEIGEQWEVAESGMGPTYDIDKYRAKIEQYIREHLDNITIRKVRSNKPITSQDIEELERLLMRATTGLDEDTLRACYGEGHSLGSFVRSLVGLDREAAKGAFSRFLDNTTYNVTQITFINWIIDNLTQNGIMEPRLLWEQPFTDLADDGVTGLFEERDVKSIVEIVRSINENAGLAA